ncbi:hypothetical protein [Flavobacterium sp.]|uniref:hypothetical protein n=1 Tax=Flavobacterium sp. TaxID=239 RepID=UPI00378E4DE4
MTKKDILIGFVIGILASVLGSYLFITLFTNFSFISGIQIMKSEGKLGKIMTLGSILDLIAFAILLKLNKEIMARGVVLAVISIAILTFFA